MQFLSIIRSAPEDSIKAAYATKVASLVESYAQPAEYAKTMADVLVAAGNAAPKSLASRIASTLAMCGEAQVQADTAKVFARLLRGPDSLSDAQLLVSPSAPACLRCTLCPGLHVCMRPQRSIPPCARATAARGTARDARRAPLRGLCEVTAADA